MKGLIEVEIGEIVKIGDESHICVKDSVNTERSCDECAFSSRACCLDYACSKWERYDNTGVHFEKQKGGKE